MDKLESFDPGNKRSRGKWWEWLVFAAVLELYVPSRKGRKMQWWDWLVLAAMVSSALLGRSERNQTQPHGKLDTTQRPTPRSIQPLHNQRVA